MGEGVIIMKFIGKIRCSTNKQDLESQRFVLQEWADKYNHTIEFSEEFAVSGKKDIKQRKEMDNMLQRCDAGEFEGLVVAEISRLGRSIKMIYDIVERLTKAGIKIVLANSNTTLDYNTLEGRALIGGLALAADIEWMLISERNKRGRDKIKRDGIKVGRKKKEELGLSVEAVSALRSKGMSMRLIGKELGASPATIMRIIHSLEIGYKPNIQQSNQDPPKNAQNEGVFH